MLKKMNKKITILILSFIMVLGCGSTTLFASAATGTQEVPLPAAESIIELTTEGYELSWTDEGILWKTKEGAESTQGAWTPIDKTFDLNQGPFSLEFTHDVWDEELGRLGNSVTVYFSIYDSQGYSVSLLIDGYTQIWTTPMVNEITVTIFPNCRGDKPWADGLGQFIYPVTKSDGDFVRGGDDLKFAFDKEKGFVSTYQGEEYIIDDVDGTFKKLREDIGFAKDGIITCDLIMTSLISDGLGSSSVLKSINGQSLVRKSDTTIEDTVAPAIILNQLSSGCKVNEVYSAESAFASDVIDSSVDFTMEVKKDGTTVRAAEPNLTFTPESVGNYELVFKATDDAGNVTTKTSVVTVKDNFTYPVITVDGDYPATVNCDEKLTILGFTAEDGEETLTNKIEIIQNGEVLQTVSAGDQVTLPLGIITIRYTSSDAANPEPNVTVKEFEVICVDTEAPVLTVAGVPESAKQDDIVTLPAGTATDNSGNVELTITVTSPSKKKVELDMNNFVAEEVGVYTVVYRAQDSLGNFDEESFEITVTENEGGCNSSVAGGVYVVLPVLFTGVALLIAMRRRNNRG